MARLRAVITTMLRKWFRRRRPALIYSDIRTVESMNDVPNKFTNEIYLVARGDTYRWALLMCPCGCGERLDVNLMRTSNPHWRLTLKKGKVSLSPSIWVTGDKCGSHFWLIENRLHWFGK